MLSNLFVTKNNPLKEIVLNYYYIDGEISPNDFYSIMKGAENYLLKVGFISATMGDKVLFLRNPTYEKKSFTIGKYVFKLASDKITLRAEKNSTTLSNLVLNSLKMKALEIGYTGPESQKFYKIIPYKTDFFSYHDAFEYDITIMKDGNVGIWLDPSTKWKQKFPVFLDWVKTQNWTKEEIKSYLIGKIVRCPSPGKKSYRAEIVNVCFKPINDYKIPFNGQEITIFDYWTKVSENHSKWLLNNSIQLHPTDEPVITVQIKNMNVRPSFPAAFLELIIDINDPKTPEGSLSEKKILKPIKRIEDTKLVFNEILREGLYFGDIHINFDKNLINWQTSGKDYGRVQTVPSPVLRFGENYICKVSNPNDNLDRKIAPTLKQYGPVTIKEKIICDYIVPLDLEKNIPQLNTQLNKISKQLNLAELSVGEIKSIERVHPDKYLRECKQIKNNNNIAIVVLPETHSKAAYNSAKRGLGENYVKSQMIEFSTFQKIIKESSFVDFTISNIVSQIYDKSLQPGESIWHLNNPAGGLNPTAVVYFMGFDVSRSPERRKEAAAYAAVCDSYGKMLSRKTIDTHKGEKIQANVLSDWFFDVAVSTFDSSNDKKTLDCIILFKDGPIPSNQIIDYKNGSLDAKQRLIKEGIMTENSDIKIISVIKRGAYRIYIDEQNNNNVNNTAIIWDNNSALIVTAQARQGTAEAFRINIEFQINPDLEILQIVHVFNDLRYLDWSSLFMQPKTILPLHIVQNLAKLSAQDINVPYIPR